LHFAGNSATIDIEEEGLQGIKSILQNLPPGKLIPNVYLEEQNNESDYL